MTSIRKIIKARAPPSFPRVQQKCISDEDYTSEIAKTADYNSAIRAQTQSTSALIASFQAVIFSSTTFPTLAQATAENPSSYEYPKISLYPRADSPITESTLLNHENPVRTIVYPRTAFPSTTVQIYVLKGSRPLYEARQGTIYFSQLCAIPESTPQSIETTLLPRDWAHTEEALVIDPLNGTGTRYVNHPLINKFSLADWYTRRFGSSAKPISLATGHQFKKKW